MDPAGSLQPRRDKHRPMISPALMSMAEPGIPMGSQNPDTLLAHRVKNAPKLPKQLAAYVLVLSLLATLLGCKSDGPKPPKASPTPSIQGNTNFPWDTNPTALVIRYYSPYTTAGLAGAYNRHYYIPEVQVWGNGRIIWVVREGISRRVLEGRLTTERLKALLRRIVEAGFFDWEEEYYTFGGHSFPPMHLSVSLIDQSKEVSEHGGAPEAFYELVEFLTSGAGTVGNDFTPTQGYLTAVPGPGEANAPQWPDATVGFTLGQVGDGRYIEGEALAFTWEAVNRNPTAPVYVKSNGQVYAIMVQIPGVSLFEPPTPNPPAPTSALPGGSTPP